jgi:hypothetical protein
MSSELEFLGYNTVHCASWISTCNSTLRVEGCRSHRNVCNYLQCPNPKDLEPHFRCCFPRGIAGIPSGGRSKLAALCMADTAACLTNLHFRLLWITFNGHFILTHDPNLTFTYRATILALQMLMKCVLVRVLNQS